MSESCHITQNQINTLLAEVSIEDKIKGQHRQINYSIKMMLQKSPSRELLILKKDLAASMQALNTKKPFSKDAINSFKNNLKNFSNKALSISKDYDLFRLATKLENMTGFMFSQADQERRKHARFPFAADLILNTDGQEHKLIASDISSGGISFFSPVELVLGRRYTINITVSNNQELTFDVLRVSRIESEQPNIFRTSGTFPDLIDWNGLKDIIISSFE